jgi:DNA primase
MKQIPRETIEEVRSRNDIADVIGSYLSLKNAGTRFKANCPFHKEKTPSFTVSPDRQIYHCFGCGAGGDVIRFIQEY